MFDLPLHLSRHTLNDELRVEPESLPDEIRESKVEAAVALDEERAALEKELKTLELAVPGLAQARQRVKEARAKTEKEPQLFEEAREQLGEAEVRAMRVNPGYREMMRKLQDTEQPLPHLHQPEARPRAGLFPAEVRHAWDSSISASIS
jgi:hypothetical protein